MTVAAYIERFEYLARFYTPEVTEEWRCRRFEGGLKHEIRRFIVPKISIICTMYNNHNNI